MEKKSETLKRLWPEYFSDQDVPQSLVDAISFLQDIEYRYNRECKTTVTREQVNTIPKLISDLKDHYASLSTLPASPKLEWVKAWEENKHTAGEWKTLVMPSGIFAIGTSSPSKIYPEEPKIVDIKQVCPIRPFLELTDEDKANAYLISAAPNLLAACQARTTANTTEELEQADNLMLAAINKALNGETPSPLPSNPVQEEEKERGLYCGGCGQKTDTHDPNCPFH